MGFGNIKMLMILNIDILSYPYTFRYQLKHKTSYTVYDFVDLAVALTKSGVTYMQQSDDRPPEITRQTHILVGQYTYI